MSNENLFAILYDDPDHKPEIFCGDGAEEAARLTFKERAVNWSCYLVGDITSLERENAELRKDKERLEALWESNYLATLKAYVACEDWPMRHQIDFVLKKLHSSNAATKAEGQ